jgi:hypothetical protein
MMMALRADVAQLVERLLAMQKVEGSSPFIRSIGKARKRGPFHCLGPLGGASNASNGNAKGNGRVFRAALSET